MKEAILAAARKQPGLNSLTTSQNFGQDWDLPRFVYLLTSIKQKHARLPYFKDIVEELVTWRGIRNEHCHQSFLGKDGAGEGSEEELGKRISRARFLIPEVNGLRRWGREGRRLEERLRELESFLEGDDESDV